ncbi:MAG TPA: L-histidine N(alpha)-methyltransferase [Terriglobales bacterium]|nr:L-histidine N(alpha)-methyltransferase [Terriglobales bacterium]
MNAPTPLPLRLSPIARDVLAGLSRMPKSLPPKLFYDARGSALFEQITQLPEYYLTRTERGILEESAAEIVSAAGIPLTLIELGAGTASKTRTLIRAILERQENLEFIPLDISHSALEEAVGHLNGDFPGLRVRPVVMDYTAGLGPVRELRGRKLALYLGSSIGNFEPMQAGRLLRNLRHSLHPGDALLLGTDMVKPRSILLPAYNDSQGVTAEFNRNVLVRINRELEGGFQVGWFRHRARWNPGCSRIEMHLESVRRQVVPIGLLGEEFSFARGETIHTENSYKFTPNMVRSILDLGGFALERSWSDAKGWFALHLARVA